MQLGVDQPRVIVLNGDHDGMAHSALPATVVTLLDAVARRVKARRLVGVDVQQRPGLRPLKAFERLAAGAPTPRATVTTQHLPDRRAVKARQRRQSHRPPIRALTRIYDPLLLLCTERMRTRLRHRPARRQAAEVRATASVSLLPTQPVGPDRRR